MRDRLSFLTFLLEQVCFCSTCTEGKTLCMGIIGSTYAFMDYPQGERAMVVVAGMLTEGPYQYA